MVSESESDNPEVFAKLKETLSEQGRMLISKRRKAIRRRARRSRAKAIAERRLLSKMIDAAKFCLNVKISER